MEQSRVIVIQLKLTRERVFFLLAFLFLTWRPGPLGSETLTLTTYYPAPYGGYVSILTTGNTWLARDGNSRVGIGTSAPTAKLDITGGGLDINGGGIELDGGKTIHSSGIMYIDGEKELNLLNKNGVIIGAGGGGAGGGIGDLKVQGKLFNVCISKMFSSNGTTTCPGTHPMVIGSYFTGTPVFYAALNSTNLIKPAGEPWWVTQPVQRNGRWLYEQKGQDWSGYMTCCNMDLPQI